MIINMNVSRLRTIEQIERFPAGNREVGFSGYENDLQRHAHLSRVLKRFDYPRRNKRERGVLLAYLRRTSGYSRAQLTRLMSRWRANRKAATPLLKRYSAPVAPFERKYLATDIARLVEMDKASANVCGPATAHLLKRAYQTYGDERYQRLAGLPVSHLYNLRKSAGYQTQRTHFTTTHPARSPIRVRKAPRPNGRADQPLLPAVLQPQPMTDLAAAQQMQQAKDVLFKGFANPKHAAHKNEQRYPESISPCTAAGRLESAFNTRSI